MEFRGSHTWTDKNQIVKLPKMGWFNPYSCTYVGTKHDHKKIYDFHDDLPKRDPLLHNQYFERLRTSCEDVASRLGKLGISSQKQTVVLLEFLKNKTKVKDLITWESDTDLKGWSDERTGSIYINKGLIFTNPKDFREVLIHEFAHSYWNHKLNKDTKMYFIQWYRKNIVSPTFSKYFDQEPISVELDENDYETIWHLVYTSQEPLRVKLNKLIPNLIYDRLKQKDPSVKFEVVKEHVKPILLYYVKTDKKLLLNQQSFFNFLERLKFSGKVKKEPTDLISSDYKELRQLAYESGKSPSEYAATNPSELWAETIMYAAYNLSDISKELKDLIVNIISGTVKNV